MQFRYDEDFLEAAVFVCASGHRRGTPSLQIARFHREREKLYRILDPDERNTAFFTLHLEWFREWGLERVLTELLVDFPLMVKTLAFLGVRQTRNKTDEGAELYVNESGQRSALLALRPESFSHEISLRQYLRHEFMHLNDMVDPRFGYSPSLDLPGFNSAQQRLARERYRLLWDVTIDGRLSARGHKAVQAREQHAAAFDRGYSFWTEDKRAEVFDTLWNSPAPKHSDFLELIADPRGLRHTNRPAPGASCPLCEFPTFAWAKEHQLPEEILGRIRCEFPGWEPEQGLCNRCLETYEAVSKYS